MEQGGLAPALEGRVMLTAAGLGQGWHHLPLNYCQCGTLRPRYSQAVVLSTFTATLKSHWQNEATGLCTERQSTWA